MLVPEDIGRNRCSHDPERKTGDVLLQGWAEPSGPSSHSHQSLRAILGTAKEAEPCSALHICNVYLLMSSKIPKYQPWGTGCLSGRLLLDKFRFQRDTANANVLSKVLFLLLQKDYVPTSMTFLLYSKDNQNQDIKRKIPSWRLHVRKQSKSDR